MFQKIKEALNNSFLWLLFLVGVIAYLFRKEKHLEDQLREQKFDDSIKETKDEQTKIDSDAAADYSIYEHQLREYYADNLRSGSKELQQGGAGAAETGPDQGSKN